MAGSDAALAATIVEVQVSNIVVVEVLTDAAVIFVPAESSTTVVEVLVPGPQGARGPPGTQATVLELPIKNASSISANHAFAYAPRVWLLDASGAEVETDIRHAPGQVVAVFPEPFSGTLYLG